MWAHSVDLVDEILNADNVLLASQSTLNYSIVGEWDTLTVDLPITSLVDELLHSFSTGVAISDIWLNSSQHVNGSLVDSDEHSVV